MKYTLIHLSVSYSVERRIRVLWWILRISFIRLFYPARIARWESEKGAERTREMIEGEACKRHREGGEGKTEGRESYLPIYAGNTVDITCGRRGVESRRSRARWWVTKGERGAGGDAVTNESDYKLHSPGSRSHSILVLPSCLSRSFSLPPHLSFPTSSFFSPPSASLIHRIGADW